MPFKHIRFSEPIGELSNRVKFYAPKHSEMVSVYDNPEVLMALGTRNIEILYNETLLVFEATMEWCETKFKTKDPEIITHSVMNYVKQTADSLWFAMDNSGVTSEAFFISEDRKTIYCDRSDQFSSNSHGEYKLTNFGTYQITYARAMMDKLLKITSSEPKAADQGSDGSFKQTLGSILNRAGFAFNRVKRAKTMLNHARSESYLPMKISMYMACLECLFTSDASEISMKLTQRTTLFLGGDAATQHANKKTVSDAYNIRSIYLHGNNFEKKQKTDLVTLQSISRKIDSIVRAVFIKMIEKPEMFLDDNNFDSKTKKYFEDIIYGLIPESSVGRGNDGDSKKRT
jgi:hypothetical protein